MRNSNLTPETTMSDTFNNKKTEQPNIQEEQANNNFDDSDFIIWLNKKFDIPKEVTNNLEVIVFSILFVICFYFAFIISDPIFPKDLWFLLSLDFFISIFFSISKIRSYCNKINKNLPTILHFNKTSYFSHHSILYRITRFVFYYIYALYTVRGFYDLDLLLISIFLFFLILFYTILSVYYQFDPTHKIYDWYANRSGLIKLLIVVFCIGVIGVLARLYHVYSIGTWDEGWYSDIAMRMARDQNWLLPLYYSDSDNTLKLFDKPPFLFWLGAFAIDTIGNNSLAVKWPMGVLSGLMGLFGFLIYHHQKRKNDTDIIPKNGTDSKYYGEYDIKNVWGLEKLDEKPEEEEESSDGFSIGVIFGLLMSLTWFVMFYGRTSYLDPAVVGITALTAVFGIKAIDHWFYGNTRKSIFYLLLTGIINAIDLFSKSWQGLIVGPPIALYFILRFMQHFIPKHNIRRFLSRIRKKLFVISKDLEPEVSAMLGTILALIIFSSLFQDGAIKLDFFGFFIDFWGVIIVVILFFAINSFLQSIFETPSPMKEDSDKNQENSEELVNSKENTATEAYLLSDSQKNFFRIQKNVLFIILGLSMGIVAGYLSFFGFNLIYSRFLEPITSILVTFLGGGSTSGSVDIAVSEIPSDINSILGLLVTGFFSLISGLTVGIFSVWMTGIIIIAIVQVLKETIEQTRISNKNNDLTPFFEKFSAPWAKGIILDLSLIIPLIPLGIAIGFWGVYLLFFGDFFNRDWLLITVAGIIILLISFFVSLFTLELAKKIYKYQLKISTGYSDIENYYFSRWTFRYEKFLLFTLVLLIVVIISFAPFMWWIQYLDANMEELGYFIRKAGELYRDPNSPGECLPLPGDPVGSCITYTWLFFEFYISWRYDFGTSYNVAESLGGFIEPLFIVCFPFFLAGIWAFHKKRDYASLSLYLSWFLLVLFIFVPAKFQLNYYYLAAFFPYFAIAANGIFYSLKKVKSSIHLKDMYERTVLLIPLFILLTIAQIGPYLINFNLLLTDTNTMKFFLSALILILGLFLAIALFIVRSIPGMFAAMLVTFQIHRYVWLNGWGEFDGMYLLLNIILIAIPLYLLRDRIPYRSLLFIGIIVLSGALGSAWWVNWKSGQGEDGFERMGNFIITHGGENNKSTWVYNEPGIRHAIRYYMKGNDPINIRSTPEYSNVDLPFTRNNPDEMEKYLKNNPSVNFFILDENKKQADFEQSYNWLENHYIDVNPILGLSQGHSIHLFVNPDILTDLERSQIGIGKFQYTINDTNFNINDFNTLPNLNPNLTSISQLSIRGNSQFEADVITNNWTGLGTEISPYIIEGMNITSDSSGIPVLSLSDISLHIIIQNNSISSLGNRDSVLELSNTINVEIKYNIFKNSGISIDINSDIDINNNYISESEIGIQIQRSSSAEIYKNYIDNNNGGITLFLSSSANILNNFISNSKEDGIYLLSNSAATIDNNYLINNTNGINSLDSSLKIKNNIFFDTKYNAIQLFSNTNTEIHNNTIQNGLNGITVNIVSLIKNSRNFSIENNTISFNKFDGLRISNTTEMVIKGNRLSNNGANGIWTMFTPFLQIINNELNKNLRSGIISINNNGLQITNNTIGKNGNGITFKNCFVIECIHNRSTISGNHIRENSEKGIYSRDVQGYDYNQNIFYNNNKIGIYLLNSYYNNIYENSFINNSQQAFNDNFSNNFTYNSKGNYWSDYLGKDENSDGIGDQKYLIPGRSDLYDSLPFFEAILMEIQPSQWEDIIIPGRTTKTQQLSINGFIFIFSLFTLLIINLIKKKRKK